MTRQPMPPENVSELYGRSRGICEFPGCGDMATVIHHARGRVGSDPHAVERLRHVCEPHHLHIHANPAESYGNGMLLSRHAPVAPHVRDEAS